MSGKEAGLGDESQVHIVVTATALCINGGGNHPKAVNKESVSAEGIFPVQNGKAEFQLSVTATFSPPCSPPMTVEFTDITVTDTTNNISSFIPGPIQATLLERGSQRGEGGGQPAAARLPRSKAHSLERAPFMTEEIQECNS